MGETSKTEKSPSANGGIVEKILYLLYMKVEKLSGSLMILVLDIFNVKVFLIILESQLIVSYKINIIQKYMFISDIKGIFEKYDKYMVILFP